MNTRPTPCYVNVSIQGNLSLEETRAVQRRLSNAIMVASMNLENEGVNIKTFELEFRSAPVWCESMNKKRDFTGVFHLQKDVPGPDGVVWSLPACGAKPFASGGGFSSAEVPRERRCSRCDFLFNKMGFK